MQHLHTAAVRVRPHHLVPGGCRQPLAWPRVKYLGGPEHNSATDCSVLSVKCNSVLQCVHVGWLPSLALGGVPEVEY